MTVRAYGPAGGDPTDRGLELVGMLPRRRRSEDQLRIRLAGLRFHLGSWWGIAWAWPNAKASLVDSRRLELGPIDLQMRLLIELDDLADLAELAEAIVAHSYGLEPAP